MGKPGAADLATDFNGLKSLKNQAHTHSRTALKETAQQFEGVFLQTMMKNMRQAGSPLESGMLDSNGGRIFRDMHDQHLAQQMAKQSKFGFADLLVKQLDGTTAKPKATGSGAAPQGKTLADYRLGPLRPLAVKPKDGEKAIATKPASEALRRNLALRTRNAPPAAAPQTAAKFNDEKHFLRELLPQAKAAAKALGVDPKLLLSQAALETGWGKATIRRSDGSESFNMFGIKADTNWQGRRVAASTLEYIQGVPVRKTEYFRAYNNYAEGFNDYVNLLRNNPRYSQALAHAASPQHYANELQKAGYATDPHYANKVMNIYRQWHDYDGATVAAAENTGKPG